MGSEDLRRPETVSERRHIRNTCNPRKVSNKTLGSVLNLDKKSSPEKQTRRTLFDIIQADSTGDSKKTWRYFRNKLLLKRADAAWTSILRSEMQRADSINNNGGNNSMNSRMVLRRPSTRIPTSDPDIDSPSGRTRSSSLQKSISNLSNEEPPEENEGTPASEKGEGEEGSGKMSLMALLAYTMDDEEEVDEEDDDGGENAESGALYNNCCVCMVRHKGAAFIPCGHTFCRLCSRELYVQREYCPLCNRYILEILDIF